MQHILAYRGFFLDTLSAFILYILITVCNEIKTHIERTADFGHGTIDLS